MKFKVTILLSFFCLYLFSQNTKLKDAIHAHEFGANRMAIDLLNKIDYKALSKTDKVIYWRTCFLSNYDSYQVSKAKSASYNLWLLENPKKDTNSIYTAQYYAYMALCYHYDIRADSATILSKKSLKILHRTKENVLLIDHFQVYRSHASAARNLMPDSLYDYIGRDRPNEYTKLREKYIMAYFDTAMYFCENQYGKNSLQYASIARNRANANLDIYKYYLEYQKETAITYKLKIVALYNLSSQILKNYYGANNPGIADNYLLLGLTEYYDKNQKKALYYFHKSKELIFHTDENNQVICCNNSQALDYYRFVSFAYSLDFKENKKILVALKSIELFKKAVPVYSNFIQELNLEARQPIIDPYYQNPFASLSGIYSELYEITKNKNYLDSAFIYSEKLKRLTLFYFNKKKYLSQQIKEQLIENENSIIFNKKIILKNKKAEYDSLISNSISINEIQSILKPSEAFISYSYVNSNLNGLVLVAFVMTRTKKECVKLNIELNNDLLKTNKFKLLNDSSALVFKKFSNKIYDQYFKPICSIFDSTINQLYIVPTAWLIDFPFELLVAKTPTTNTYNYTDFLTSKYTISYQFFAGFDLTKSKKENYTCGINTLIPRLSAYNLTALPFCTKISKSIADSYKNSSLNDLAAVNDFYAALNNPNCILQVFTHSGIDKQNTSNSKLYFSDSVVSMNEIYTKKVSCPLVFLSSCETDKGLFSDYDGQLNFVRALSFAGAKSIVSTFWESDDKAAAYITQYFYYYLAKGYNKAAALQKAKQQFIIDFPQLNNPLYWGAFKITGDISSLNIQESDRISNVYTPLFLLLSALILGALLVIKKQFGK